MQLLSAADFSLTDEKDNKMFCDNQPSTSARPFGEMNANEDRARAVGDPGDRVHLQCAQHEQYPQPNPPKKTKPIKYWRNGRKGSAFITGVKCIVGKRERESFEKEWCDDGEDEDNNDRESVEGRRSAVTGESTFMFHS